MSIRQLSVDTRRQLRSEQTIGSLVDVVKELVENAIDAGARRVRVQFHAPQTTPATDDEGYRVDVVDDGCGIASADFDLLCKPHSTSKIDSFDALGSLRTLGFRGEALHALCALASVRILTRQSTTSSSSAELASTSLAPATLLEFDAAGDLRVRRSLAADSRLLHASGTCVAIDRLFAALPVRLRMMRQKEREQARQLESLITHFKLVCESTLAFCDATVN